MGEILRKVVDEHADVVLVYPEWPRYWQVMFRSMGERGAQMAVKELPHRPDLFSKGPRVPGRRGGDRAPFYRVSCAVIVWPAHLRK